MKYRYAVALVSLVGTLAPLGRAGGGDAAKSPAVNLLGGPIDDMPVRVSVPISKDSSLVVPLEHHWIRVAPPVVGPELRLDYIPQLQNGGFGSAAAVGAVPLPEAKEGEKPADRVRRAAAEFFTAIEDCWKGQFKLISEPGKIKAENAVVKIDGHKTPAARSSKFNMKIEGATDGPNSLYTGECIAFNVEGTETLAYVAINTSKSGTSLEKLVAGLSVQKNVAVNRNGLRVALIEGSVGKGGRIPVRLVCFDDAPGFLPYFGVASSNERVYAEDRVDDQGSVTASLRIRKRDPAEVSTLEIEGELELKLMGIEGAIVPKKVDLLTKGVRALVYSYPSKLDEKECAASTAVLYVVDQVWAFTWYTFGDDARVKADQVAFQYLLNRMQLAER